MSRVYIHEFVDIIGHQRARYMQHMTANWGPIGRDERNQLCFGVWGVIGSTGRWPQVVNLWEYGGWGDLARNFEVEVSGSGLYDPSLDEWWATAASMRSGGVDRICVAPDWSPSIEEICAEGPPVAAGYAHELIRCRPGAAHAVLDAVETDGMTRAAELGLHLTVALRRAMADDDEVILVWSFADWETWGHAEAAMDDRTRATSRWRHGLDDEVVGWERILLADAPLSPLRTGRQPRVEDRRPLEEL